MCKRALWRWILGLLGLKIVTSGVLLPEGPLGPLGPDAVQRFLSAAVGYGFALLLFSGLLDLALRRIGRRERSWFVAPFAVLTLLLALIPGVPVAVVVGLSAPLLYRLRWKSALTGGFRFLLFLAALATLVVAFVDIQWPGAAGGGGGATGALERVAGIALGVARIQLLLLLPRLLGGHIVYFRSIQRRLVLSHLLVGVVPLVLALIFWGVLTYMSVGTERAVTAMRLLEAESATLGAQLGAAVRVAGSEDTAAVAQRLSDRYPDIRVHRQVGGVIEGLPNVAAWPESLPGHAVVILDGAGYLGAVVRPAPAVALLALVPLRDRVETELARQLRAELRLHGASELRTRRGGIQLDTDSTNDDEAEEPDSAAAARAPAVASAAGESIGVGGAPPRKSGPGFKVSGATTVTVVRPGRDAWRRGNSLLTAYVPFRDAAIGLVTGLRENPFAVVPIAILGFLAFLLLVVENFTIGMVVGLSKSVTAAVAALRRATVALKAGNLGYRIPIRAEDNDELWNVAESFNTMATGLEEARETERERERLEKELQLARQIQARLLPDRPPLVVGLDLSGLSLSAQEVGGDYYDFIPLADGRVALVIADVSGKGVPASLLMSAFRASLLSQQLDAATPGAILERINHFLHRSVEPGRFVTAFLAFLDPKNGAITYSNAGHNAPFVFPASDAAPNPLIEGGPMLGAFESGRWDTAPASLAPGDLLVLYTDGVTEAQNEAGDFWDEEGLLDFVSPRRESGCGRLAPEIVAEVRRFEGQQGPSDDITLLLARRLA